MLLLAYDGRLRFSDDAEQHLRSGREAWMIGVFLDFAAGRYFESIPDLVIYTIRYEDGQAANMHQSQHVPF